MSEEPVIEVWLDVSSMSDEMKTLLFSLPKEETQELLDALFIAEHAGEEWWQQYLKQKFPEKYATKN